MIKKSKDSIVFSGSEEFDQRSPVQDVLYDVIEVVNERVKQFYRTDESRDDYITPPEMLIMVAANVFANIAHNMILPRDLPTKLKVFRHMNEELTSLNQKLFYSLQAFYADDKNIN